MRLVIAACKPHADDLLDMIKYEKKKSSVLKPSSLVNLAIREEKWLTTQIFLNILMLFAGANKLKKRK